MNLRFSGWAATALRFGLVPFLAFLALSAWALSSPVGASPDEDFHLSSIWCGQGLERGICEAGPASDERMVREPLPFAAACYAYKPDASAHCQAQWFAPESEELIVTDRGNFTGEYPPGFYFVMRSFVGSDISHSVVAMRLFNAAVFVGLVTALYWLLPRGRRTMATVGAAVALVPLGVFVIPSINPSSWAVTSIALVFPAMVGFFETTGHRRIALAAIAGVATLMGASARADAAVYAAVAVCLAILLMASWRAGAWRLLAYPALLCGICLVSYLSAGQTKAASVGFDGQSGPIQGFVDLVGYNLLNVPELWAGSFGSWGLGWLDTRMPSVVWVVNLATFGAVLYLGARQTSLRKTACLLLTLAAAWALPTLVLVQSAALVGTEVQPRYLLPLLILLAQVALFRAEAEPEQLTRSQLTAIAVALTATNAISLHFNIRRYVTGTDVFALNLDAAREWWWGFAPSPMALWFVGSVAFGGALLVALRSLVTDEVAIRVDSPAEDSVPVGAVPAR